MEGLCYIIPQCLVNMNGNIINCSCIICRLVINNWKLISVKYVEHVSFLSLYSDTNDFCWITPLGNLWGNQGPTFAQKLGSLSGFLTLHWTLRYLSQKPGSYASFPPLLVPQSSLTHLLEIDFLLCPSSLSQYIICFLRTYPLKQHPLPFVRYSLHTALLQIFLSRWLGKCCDEYRQGSVGIEDKQ